MSLKKTLGISLEILNVSQAVKDVERVRKEVGELQTAAERVRVRVNAHDRNRTQSESFDRKQNRDAALNFSTIGLPRRKIDAFGSQFLPRNPEADVDEFLTNFRKIQDRKAVYEKEATADPFGSRFLSKPLNPKVAERLDARADYDPKGFVLNKPYNVKKYFEEYIPPANPYSELGDMQRYSKRVDESQVKYAKRRTQGFLRRKAGITDKIDDRFLLGAGDLLKPRNLDRHRLNLLGLEFAQDSRRFVLRQAHQ